MAQSIDMNTVVGTHNILFVCIDTLRYDIAFQEQECGGTPVLNQYGPWRKCQAPGNFTYPSHQAMFAGFFPIDEGIKDMKKREILFFSEDIGMGRKAPAGAFTCQGATIIEGLAYEGYETYCIGGVHFFDKRTAIGKVLPSYFQHSYWNPSFGCKAKDSATNQVDFALHTLAKIPPEKLVFFYINFSAVHYPNYHYIEGQKKDCPETHAAALRYVDQELGRLLDAFSKRGDTFVICLSDHGSCHGEDDYWYHGINHPIVNTVPYKHFFVPHNAVTEPS